jgi:hypothetical protein
MRKKGVFLFLALLLPVFVFLFLKMFGKNEFDVEVLFQREKPAAVEGCREVTLPYRLGDDVLRAVLPARDSLALVYFVTDSTDRATATEMAQLKEELAKDAVAFTTIGGNDERFSNWYACRFLMRRPLNTVLVDQRGSIRGQYDLSDRDEGDRLRTEITIILKKY